MTKLQTWNIDATRRTLVTLDTEDEIMTDYFIVRVRGQQTVRNWDEVVPIGTLVVHAGIERLTESHAGLGNKYEPCVFLSGIVEPVPLAFITVPGWTMKAGRYNKLGEHSK